jgi:lipopolysaccharide biosynthesis glycosyltransferase
MGMHRSGTSCVAGLLDAIGVSLGPESALMKATQDNPRGYFENLDFNQLLIDLLEGAGADWWRIRDFDVSRLSDSAVQRGRSRLERLLAQFADSPVFALKDPRLCLLLPALRPVFPDPIFLHVVRSPIEVARSLNKRDGFGFAEGIALWESYNRRAIAATEGESRLLLNYGELVAHAESTTAELISDLHGLGAPRLSLPEPGVLAGVVDRELHRQKAGDAGGNGLLTEAQKAFWAQLRDRRFPDLEERPEAAAHRRVMLTCLEAQVVAQAERSIEAKQQAVRKENESAIRSLNQETAKIREENRVIKAQFDEFAVQTSPALRDLSEENRRLRSEFDQLAARTSTAIQEAAEDNRQFREQVREIKTACDALKAGDDAKSADLQALASNISAMQEKIEVVTANSAPRPSLLCKLGRSLSRAKYRLDHWNDPVARSLLRKIGRDFDRHYYFAKYADVRRTCIDPRVHFLKYGWQEGRKPHPKRTAEDLLKRFPQIRRIGTQARTPLAVAPAETSVREKEPPTPGEQPVAHGGTDSAYWATRQEVLTSGFWDERWYLRNYYTEYRKWKTGRTSAASPVDHFLQVGAEAGYKPSPRLSCRKAFSFKGLNPVSALLYKVRPNFHFDENIWIPEPEAVRSYLAARATRDSKKVVYSCNLENYDSLIQPYALDPEWDYVLFTDDEHLVRQGWAGVWEVRPALRPDLHAVRRNRFHKIHPHLLFPDYEESIYIDGNVNIISSFLFDEIRSRKLPILLPQHFGRDCAYSEIEALLRSPRTSDENRQILPQQREFLESMGLPKEYGLTENNIIYRRHHDKAVVRMMDRWWEQILDFSYRDQVSMSYVLWKEGLSPRDVSFPPARLLDQDFWIVGHTAEHASVDIRISEKITPVFDRNAVVLVLSSNESFVGYLGVVITSVIENASDDRSYDVIVLEKDISDNSKELLRSLQRRNVSIRFYNMTSVLFQLEDLEVHVEGYVPAETYNKIFLGEIMEGYEKVLYIDTDIVVRRDIAELFDTDLFGKALGASRNIANIHAAHLNKEIKGRKFGDYLRDELGITDFDSYFQAGVILLDLTSAKAQNLLTLSIQKIREIRQPVFFDQCIFNAIFSGDVHFVSTTWNHVWYLQNYSYLRHTLNDETFFDYARSRLDPAIVHFAGKDKPTNKFDWRLSSHFWLSAARSPFAEVLLRQADDAQYAATGSPLRLDALTAEPAPRILVHLHAFHEDQLPYMFGKLESIGGADWDLVVTTSAADDAMEGVIKSRVANAEIMRLKNQGFDAYPFLKVIEARNLSQYDYVLKLHTKSPRPESPESNVYGIAVPGHTWRNELVDALLGSREEFSRVLTLLQEDPSVGCVAAKAFIFSINENDERKNYDLRHWMNRFHFETGEHYVGGTMFLARAYPFERLKAVKPDDLDFESGSSTSRSHKNLAHVFERLFGIAIEAERLSIQGRGRTADLP